MRTTVQPTIPPNMPPPEADTSPTAAKPPSMLELFALFFRISSVTIGGGYVMVPVIQRALEKKGWLPEEEFYDVFALAQSVPGPLALNAALFSGGRVAGPKGFIAAAVGILLPPFIAIIAVASVMDRLSTWPFVRGFLDGASAVIPGMVAALALNMIRKRRWTLRRVLASVAGATAILLSGPLAVPVFFAVVILARLLEGTEPCSR